MKTLHLTLKSRWFDMIASGEKKEEYREIKPYWNRRLYGRPQKYAIASAAYNPVNYGLVEFRNGYAKNAPTMVVECTGISIGLPAFKWYGAHTETPVFIISLGKIISIENYDKI